MTANQFIDRRQQRNLTDLLERCPSMKDKRRRTAVFKQLRDEIQYSIDPDGSLDEAAFDMVEGSKHHLDGIEELIRAVAYSERNSIPIRAIWKRLPGVLGFPDPELHVTISDVLEHFTAEHVSREAMELAFIRSVPAGLRTELALRDPDLMCRWWMLKEAQRLPQRLDGSFPLADFIGRLLPDIPDKRIAKSLIRWGAYITGETESLFKKLAERGAASAEPEALAGFHLIVRLVSKPSDPARYKVLFHRHSGNDCRSLPIDFGEDESYGCEAIASVVDEIIYRNFHRNSLGLQAIEVMVHPDDITKLTPPPHLWPLKIQRRHEIALGKQYCVYLRLDRNEIPPDLWDEWNSKWRKFNHAPSPGGCIQWEDDPTVCSWETLKEKLDRTDGPPFLILAFEPEENATWLADVLFDICMPVAIWGDGEKAQIEDLLAPLIDGGSLGSLPDHLKKWRKDTRARKLDLPHRLTLLWDDPTRDIHGRQTDTGTPRHFNDSRL